MTRVLSETPGVEELKKSATVQERIDRSGRLQDSIVEAQELAVMSSLVELERRPRLGTDGREMGRLAILRADGYPMDRKPLDDSPTVDHAIARTITGSTMADNVFYELLKVL